MKTLMYLNMTILMMKVQNLRKLNMNMVSFFLFNYLFRIEKEAK
jgi:hypothetical protein